MDVRKIGYEIAAGVVMENWSGGCAPVERGICPKSGSALSLP